MPSFDLPESRRPYPALIKDIVFRWEHRRPVRDLSRPDQPIIEPGPILSAGEKSLDLVPNAGLNWISSQMAGVTSGKCAVICVGSGTATPTMGDLTLQSEISGYGMTRTTGSVSGVGALAELAPATATYQGTGAFWVFKTFTASGTITVNEAGLGQDVIYNAGIICRDVLSPGASMAPGDQLYVEFKVIL